MAKHKARSPRAALLVVTAALAAPLLIQPSAGAVTAPGLSALAKNGDVIARCNFTLQSVNPSDGTAQVRLAANAQPASLLGYATNAYTQVFCAVLGGDQTGPVLTRFDPFANGPVVPTTSETPVIDLYAGYTLCAVGYVKKNSGAQSFTPTVCVSS
jgi:hypothetical protein